MLANLDLNLGLMISFLSILLKQLHTLVSSWLFSGYASSMPILLLSFFTNYISFSSFCYAYCSSFSLVSP